MDKPILTVNDMFDYFSKLREEGKGTYDVHYIVVWSFDTAGIQTIDVNDEKKQVVLA